MKVKADEERHDLMIGYDFHTFESSWNESHIGTSGHITNHIVLATTNNITPGINVGQEGQRGENFCYQEAEIQVTKLR